MTQLPHPLPLLVQEKVDFYRWNICLSRVIKEYHRNYEYDEVHKWTKNITLDIEYNWRLPLPIQSVIFNKYEFLQKTAWQSYIEKTYFTPKNYWYSGITKIDQITFIT